MNACFCFAGKLIASGGSSVDRVHDECCKEKKK